MKIRSLLSALSLVLAAGQLSAQSIVGAWSFGNTATADSGVIVFFSNQTYFHIENSANSANDGFERGAWTWGGTNGDAFTVTVDNDTNDDVGLSTIDPASTKLSISGNTLTMIDPDGPDTEDGELSRVTGGGALMGAWYFGDVTTNGNTNDSGVLVFLQNSFNGTLYSGNYYLARDLPFGDPDGSDEIEHGTYTWNPTTGAFALGSMLVDLNSEVGLNSGSAIDSFTVSGLTLTGHDAEGFFYLSAVSAIPEPSTYATLAGLGALGLALVRRRRVAS